MQSFCLRKALLSTLLFVFLAILRRKWLSMALMCEKDTEIWKLSALFGIWQKILSSKWPQDINKTFISFLYKSFLDSHKVKTFENKTKMQNI